MEPLLEGNPEEFSDDFIRELSPSSSDGVPRILLNGGARRRMGKFSVLPDFFCAARLSRDGEAFEILWLQDPGDPFTSLAALFRGRSIDEILQGGLDPEGTPLPLFRDGAGIEIELQAMSWARSSDAARLAQLRSGRSGRRHRAPESPIGRALVNARTGDEIEIRVGGGTKTYELVALE